MAKRPEGSQSGDVLRGMAQRKVEPAHRRAEDPRNQRGEGFSYEPAVQIPARFMRGANGANDWRSMFFWYWFSTSILIPPYCQFSIPRFIPHTAKSVSSFLWNLAYALTASSDIVPLLFSYETHVVHSAYVAYQCALSLDHSTCVDRILRYCTFTLQLRDSCRPFSLRSISKRNDSKSCVDRILRYRASALQL